MLLEHIRNDEAQLRRAELLFPPLHIAALLDGLDDGRVRARTPNPQFLEGLDDRRVVVARRRLGKVLLGIQCPQRQRITIHEVGQERVLLLLCCFRPNVDSSIALELQL